MLQHLVGVHPELVLARPERPLDLAAIRAALKAERKLRVDYVDGAGAKTTRVLIVSMKTPSSLSCLSASR